MASTDDLQSPDDIALADRMKTMARAILAELHKRIIGQHAVMELVLRTLFVGGNSLIIGVPGLAKTLLIPDAGPGARTEVQAHSSSRHDLMPSDITGTDIINEDQATGAGR